MTRAGVIIMAIRISKLINFTSLAEIIRMTKVSNFIGVVFYFLRGLDVQLALHYHGQLG